MTGYICPNCQNENPGANNICEFCGFYMQPKAIIVHPKNDVRIGRRPLPAKQLIRIGGASLVFSAAALLAEVGFLFLRRQLQENKGKIKLIPWHQKRKPEPIKTQLEKTSWTGSRVVAVYSERIVEEHRWGRPVRRILDRVVWRTEEKIQS